MILNKRYPVTPINVFRESLSLRFDLLIKLFYLRYRTEYPDLAKWVYLEHIKVFTDGTFIEPGSVRKIGSDVYLESFENLDRHISADSFDWFLSPIPVSQDFICQNGAHRLASAVFNDFGEIQTKIVDPRFPAKYDQLFFKGRGLSIKIQQLALLSLQLVNIPSLKVFVIWPTGVKKFRRSDFNISTVLYRARMRISFSVFEFLVRHIYGGEDWLGEMSDTARGSLFKAKQCFTAFDRLEIIAFLDDGYADRLKDSLRREIGFGKHSVHCTDSYSESIRLLSILALYPDLSPIHCQIGVEEAKVSLSINGCAMEGETIAIPGIPDFDSCRLEGLINILRNEEWVDSVRFFRVNGVLYASRVFVGLCVLRNKKFFVSLCGNPEISNKILSRVVMTVGDFVVYKIRMVSTGSLLRFWFRLFVVTSVSLVCNSLLYKWFKGRL